MANLFWFIVLIGILIFAHESGHFLFAKLFHVKVLTFSLGFGTPVRLGRFKLSWRRGETEYRVAWFPIGGFVRMLGEDPTEEITQADRTRSFPAQAAWKRFLIIFAGPLFSVLLAVPIYFVYHLFDGPAQAPILGLVVAGSPAGQAGLRAGDRVLQVNGVDTPTWDDVDEAVQDADGGSVEVRIEREGRQLSFRADSIRELDETGLDLLGERWDLGLRHSRLGNMVGVVAPDSPAARAGLQSWDKLLELGGVPIGGWSDIERLIALHGTELLPVRAVRSADIQIGAVTLRVPVLLEAVLQPEPEASAPAGARRTPGAYTGLEPIDLYVMGLVPGFPLEKAGVQPGDKIVAVLGQPIESWEQFSRAVLTHPDEPIPLQVRHAGALQDFRLTPELLSDTNEFKQTTRKPGLGIKYVHNLLGGARIPRPDRLTYALRMSVTMTGRAISMNVLGFVRIFEGRVAASEAIGGPLMIYQVAGRSAEKGFGTFVSLMAFMSVLLGMLNLLPIPILDGGHILFIAIEVIRRRPVSLKARIAANYVGLLLLVSLMAFAFYNDISRYWSDFTALFR
ncbi:MAG TPA: site-2 protease family protein [Myxococcota bacterium]|nr:site-2 protease family protein [Myxococcota bacterium]HRY96829.1 site-2 protease family protein [Myxococcota bacterium]HSA21685.1 site-2 protease family protein [Myxococcota bacterium]